MRGGQKVERDKSNVTSSHRTPHPCRHSSDRVPRPASPRVKGGRRTPYRTPRRPASGVDAGRGGRSTRRKARGRAVHHVRLGGVVVVVVVVANAVEVVIAVVTGYGGVRCGVT